MRVAQRHGHAAVAEEFANCVERNAFLHQPGGEMVAEIVPSEPGDLGALEESRKRRLEAGVDREHALAFRCLSTSSASSFKGTYRVCCDFAVEPSIVTCLPFQSIADHRSCRSSPR